MGVLTVRRKHVALLALIGIALTVGCEPTLAPGAGNPPPAFSPNAR